MTHLTLLKRKTVDVLKEQIESALSMYKSKSAWPAPASDTVFKTGIEVEDTLPQLAGDDPKNDALDAEKLFTYLRALTPRQASDERVWVTLTHGQFADYTYRRWPDALKADYVLDHWFIAQRGLAGLRRNALARLWWAAALTCDPWITDPSLRILINADRFFYTKVLLRSQQIFQDVMEREFGSNLKLRICFLHALQEGFAKVRSIDDLVENASKQFRLILLYRRLESASSQDVLDACRSVVNAAASALPGASK